MNERVLCKGQILNRDGERLELSAVAEEKLRSLVRELDKSVIVEVTDESRKN